MNSNRIIRSLIGLLAIVTAVSSGLAQSASISTPATTFSANGGSVTLTVTIDYTGKTLSTLGGSIALPDGWSMGDDGNGNPGIGGPNIPSGGPVVGQTSALDFFYITAPANKATFTLNLRYTGGLSVDQSLTGTISYKVTGNSTTQTINLAPVILAPGFSAVPALASKVLTAGVTAASFTPVVAVNGTAPYSYSISPALPSGLQLSSSTGKISGSPLGASTTSDYTVTISDATSAIVSNNFSLTINPALTGTVAIATKSLTVNSAAAAFTPIAITGGTLPLVYSITPALPDGLTLNAATGAISGTPTATSATTVYTVSVGDSAGATTNKAFSLAVNPAPIATRVIASKMLTAGVAAVAFTPVTVSGGSVPLLYSVSPALPANLMLDSANGQITGTPGGAVSSATYTITATDSAGVSASQTFTLQVNGPVTTTQAIANKAFTAHVPITFTPVTAAGGTAPYSFTIAPALPNGLTLNGETGEITGSANGAASATSYTITATDTVGSSSSKTFVMVVNGPVTATLSIPTKFLTVNTTAGSFTPVTLASGGTAPFQYSLSPTLPSGLSFNSSTGAITGTPTMESAATAYAVAITDAAGAVDSKSFTLKVNSTVTASQVETGKVFTANTAIVPFTPVTGGGGTTPYVFSVSPALPSGLVLNSATGEISGTPVAASPSTSYTVTVTDTAGAAATATFTIEVSGPLAATAAVTASTLTAGAAAVPFTPVTGAGGTKPYSFSIAPALPAGLTLNTSTGEISGTPLGASTAKSYTITITDAANAAATGAFTLTINGPLTASQTLAAKALTAGTATAGFAPIAAAGGTPPYSFVINPALPDGLNFAGASGAISGTAVSASADATFTVTVTDSANAEATGTFGLRVNPALATSQAIASRTLTAGTPAVAFNPVTASDGTPPYLFAVAPALPAGMSLNGTTGAISGTPAIASAASVFTVNVTDAVGAASSKTFSLAVSGAPTAVVGQTVSMKVLTAGTAVVPFTPLPVNGGTPPFTYTVNPDLPAGLTFGSGTGEIGGIAAGPSDQAIYTIRATDSVGASVTLDLTLLVNPSPVATQEEATKTLLVDVSVDAFTPVTVTGGTPPFVYSISPTLPVGLTISSATGAVSGTPSEVSVPVTYTVTATDMVGASANQTFTLKVNRAPVITAPPAPEKFYLVDHPLTLTVATNASPVPTFQWRKDGNPIPDNESATTATLTIPSLQLADAGDYDVVITNESGVATSDPVKVVVYLPPAITSQPLSQTITAGQNATFTVVATGNPAPKYQWRRNGVALPGATGASLTLAGVPLNGSGAVTVVVANPGGSVTSEPAMLSVDPVAPSFAAGLPTTATAIKDRSFFFPVAINNTVATFSATGLSGPGGTLSVNSSNGSLRGAPANVGSFPIVITATNTAGSASHTVTLTVQAPPPVITSAAAKNGRVGDATFSYQVVGTNSPTSYVAENLPPGLNIDSSTGLISGTPTAAGTFTVKLKVGNASGSITQPLVITIDPPLNAPVYTGPLNPSGTQGVAFSFTPVFGTVTAPYTLSGNLPAGLVFDETTGAITGTPTERGSFDVTLAATNAGGTTSVELTITINPAPSAPVITSASSAPLGRVGTAFSFTLTSAGTPVASQYGATGLPAGLTLDAPSGVISGTPTAFGTFDVTVNATNLLGTGPNSILTLTIAPSATAPVITSAPYAPGRVGQPFNYVLAGSNSPTSFAITEGTIPAGLTFDGATGAISGTPTTAALGATRVWFSATNGSGSGFSLEVLFMIAPALSTPVITSSGTASAQVGQPFQYAIKASSASEIVSYGATGRPDWLDLDASTGVLSGVPTEPTTQPIAIKLTATNSDGTGSPKTLQLSVAPAPATPIITSPLVAVGRVGDAFTYPITASESPTSYVALGLPPGLSLDASTGVITGTPSISKIFAVQLRAANNGGLGASSTLTIRIAPALLAPAITSQATASAQVGAAFNYQITASNGPILAYAVSGKLPLGLTLNTATGVISGTPAGEPRVYLVELTATSAGGTSLPQPLSIRVAPALGVPVITAPRYVSAQVGLNFSLTITATNLSGPAPYAPPVAIDAVNLPTGLAINPATGEIQGNPTTVGTTVATLSATNSAGVGPMRDLAIEILPAPSAPAIAATGRAVGQVGQPFSYQIVASNAPTAYEILDAPAWMTLNTNTGVITGSPVAPGDFEIQIAASNAAGSCLPVSLAVTISPAENTPVVTSSRTQTGTVGQAFSFTLAIAPSGLNASFVATGLPRGLSLDPTAGVISGTPLESGSYTITVTPSNDNGIGAPVKIRITIVPNVVFGS